MWRPLARRALLYRRTAGPGLRLPINLQVVIRPLSPIESASRFSHFSSTSHFQHNPRFFSSNSAENHDDLPSEQFNSEVNKTADGFDFSGMNAFDGNAKSELENHDDLPSEQFISEVNETTGGLDFSGMNVLGENTKSEFENEDAIFGDASENLEVNQGFGEIFFDSAPLGGNLDSVGVEGVEQVKTDDPQKVEDLLSLLQSSGIVEGSITPHLEKMDLVLDEELVLKVLETPFIPGENLMSFFNWALKKPELKLTTQLLDALSRVICTQNSKREVYALWDIVQVIGEKGLVSTESLNRLISEFSWLKKGKAAFDVFNKFEEFGCVPNADTYYLTIEALCRRSLYNWACSVCEKMLGADVLPDAEKVGNIISFLCKGGMMKDAHLVYLYGKDKKINLSRSSIDLLVCSLSRIQKTNAGKEINKELDRETVSSALGLLNDYSPEDRKSAIRPFSSVIKNLCWIGDVDSAKKLLLEMIESGPPPGNPPFNFVINGLTKIPDMEEALSMMKLMESRGLQPDVYTYTVVLSGYVRGGNMVEACKIYDEAKQKLSKLTPAAYHTLIRGFCKLEQFDKAVNLLGEMKEHGIRPYHDEYNKLIKSLCFKALDWETAEKLEQDMRENGVTLNRRTRALITAVKEMQDGGSPEPSALAS